MATGVPPQIGLAAGDLGKIPHDFHIMDQRGHLYRNLRFGRKIVGFSPISKQAPIPERGA